MKIILLGHRHSHSKVSIKLFTLTERIKSVDKNLPFTYNLKASIDKIYQNNKIDIYIKTTANSSKSYGHSMPVVCIGPW